MYCYECPRTPLVIDEKHCKVCPQCGQEQGYGYAEGCNIETMLPCQQYTHSYNSFLKYIMSVQGRRAGFVLEKRVEELKDYLHDNDFESTQANILKFFKFHKRYSEYCRVNDYYVYLTGNHPPQLNNFLVHHIRDLFRQVHDTFHQKDRKRKNLLENSYILLKLLEINHHGNTARQLVPYMKKFQVNDKLWRELCDELGWTFIKTTPYSIT